MEDDSSSVVFVACEVMNENDVALWSEDGSTCGDEIGGGGSVIEGGVIVVEGWDERDSDVEMAPGLDGAISSLYAYWIVWRCSCRLSLQFSSLFMVFIIIIF